MPPMSQYLSFLGVAAVTMVVPGPDTLVVLRTAAGGGRTAGVWAAAGSATGLLLWGVAALAGLATLITLSPAAFTVVQIAGAAYLGWLGVQALRSAWRGEALADAGGAVLGGAAFRRGLMSDLANAKVGLFWMALAPQFMGAGLGPAMALSVSALGFAWLAGYAALAGRLRGALAQPRLGRAVNALTGAVMVALAVLLTL
jgi:threonine/homoserine/homoserine lactone efflux protein